ncbi:hypothetical protein F5Y09DRAFT_335519 [Xylaria sp. FL1042]|nr:hypothetical protein F5Y09DRAFT_335519 [Xylaria sp. FL1042]
MSLRTNDISGAFAIWFCNGLVASLILARLGLRRWRQFAFTPGDGWLVVALVFTALRVVGDYYMNKYGTPLSMSIDNMIRKPRPLDMTAQERSGLVLAGKLMIATRIAVVMMRVLIVPIEINNIIADIMLFFLPIFLVLQVQIERVTLPNCGLGATLLFGLGVTLIAVEIVRLIEGLQFTNMLLNRIVWGSVEVAIAASIATLPTICILMWVGSQQRPEGGRESTHRAPWAIHAARNLRGEQASNESCPPQHIDTVYDSLVQSDNGPMFTKTGAEHNRRKPMLRNARQSSIIGSILGSVIPGANQNNWIKPESPFRSSFRGSGTGSRVSSIIGSRMRGADDSLYGSLMGWIELEEAGTKSVGGEASSPEPDDVEYRGGEIFTATEINQEAHQGWEMDRRPRIVMIPKRAKLSHPVV